MRKFLKRRIRGSFYHEGNSLAEAVREVLRASTFLQNDEKLERIVEMGFPAEVARAVLFLATERHITGTILSVDGGYTAQ